MNNNRKNSKEFDFKKGKIARIILKYVQLVYLV